MFTGFPKQQIFSNTYIYLILLARIHNIQQQSCGTLSKIYNTLHIHEDPANQMLDSNSPSTVSAKI
jgi:hypothetical protein